jgi:hypothetical protein
MRAQWPQVPAERAQLDLQPQGLDALGELEVVDDYNGPQIVFALIDGRRVLGVAADEDAQVERWVFAPVGEVERRALRAGVASLREALRKESAYVVDFLRGGRGMYVTPVNGHLLGDDVLPDEDARLDPVEALSAPGDEHLRFTLDRVGGVARGVALNAVSDFLRDLQRYANAVAAYAVDNLQREHGRFSDELLEKAAFGLRGAAAGSLMLEIEPSNPQVSERVIGLLQETIQAGDDAARLAALSSRMGSRALRRYEDMLSTLARHGMQLLVEGAGGAAFLDGQSAERVYRAMPAEVQREVEPLVLVGYFRDFGRQRQEFVFVDAEGEQTLDGAISPAVIEQNQPITVHEDSRYIVVMERQLVTTRDGKTLRRHVLAEVVRPHGKHPEPSVSGAGPDLPPRH